MITHVKRLLFSSQKKKIAITAGGFLAFFAMTGYVGYEGAKDTVTLLVNGKEEKVRTHAQTVADVLKEKNIRIQPQDYISPSLDTKVVDQLKITWEASKPITLILDGHERQLRTTARTVEDVLKAEHISIGEHDDVRPGIKQEVTNYMTIVVNKAFPISINDGGKEKELWTTSTTVGDFLAKQRITLRELDRVQPKLHETIRRNTKINIVRVEKVTDVVEESVNYATVTRKDHRLAKGKQKVLSEGEKGLVSKRYEVILKNGKEVSRKLIQTETIKPSKNRIVVVGTKEARKLLASRGEGEAVQEFYVTATAYTAYCGGCSGKTATGVNLRTNPGSKVIAVDPRIIPLGTKVYVEGYGYAIAADTGSAVKGYKIDVFFPDQSSAYRWGSKRVKIRIIK